MRLFGSVLSSLGAQVDGKQQVLLTRAAAIRNDSGGSVQCCSNSDSGGDYLITATSSW